MKRVMKIHLCCAAAMISIFLTGCGDNEPDPLSVRLATTYHVLKPTLGFKVHKISSINGKNTVCLKVPNWVVWTHLKNEGWAAMGVNKIEDLLVDSKDPEEPIPLMSKYRLEIDLYGSEKRHSMGLENTKKWFKYFTYKNYVIDLGSVSKNGKFSTAIGLISINSPILLQLHIARGRTNMASRKVLAEKIAKNIDSVIVSCGDDRHG